MNKKLLILAIAMMITTIVVAPITAKGPALKGLQSWENIPPETLLLPYGTNATTDGFLIVTLHLFSQNSGPVTVYGFSPKGNASAFTVHPGEAGTFTMPVRAGDNWRVQAFGTLTSNNYNWVAYWIPLYT